MVVVVVVVVAWIFNRLNKHAGTGGTITKFFKFKKLNIICFRIQLTFIVRFLK